MERITIANKARILTYTLIILLVSCKPATKINAYKYDQQKSGRFHHAAVVCAHPLASQAGISVIKKGGNAMDAAITTQLALAVVYPGAGNLGGGGFLVASLKDGRNICIDYREKAPGQANRDMFLDANGDPIKKLSLEGHLASGVPGTVAGLFSALKYAKLDIKTLIVPAITLAEKGFVLTDAQARSFNSNRQEFTTANKNGMTFLNNGNWKAGDTLIQSDLAETLKRIRDNGQKGFYEGETARLIVNEMKNGNGIITNDDLRAYEAKEREAIVFQYKGYKVVTMPLPSSGGVIIEQLLKMTAPYNLGSMGFQSTESVQLMVEAERRAFADRAYYLGDPDFVKVPVSEILSDTYLKKRIADYVPGVAGKSVKTDHGIIKESEETTHISIIDNEGNAVSVTTTLNDSYGSKTMVTGAGFLLNNEMDDFSVKEGAPNMYGAVGNAANAIAPGKRMLSSMTPTIILKDNKPFMVVGTPGGTTIPTSVFQSIVNVIDFGLSAEDAVNLPKFHHQWLPDVISFERNFPKPVIDNLTGMGYKAEYRSSIGRTELILIKDGKITAVADKRGDDSADGY